MSSLPALPYVVVDSDQLRFPEVIEPLIKAYDRAGQHIMLPSTSAYELTKGTGNNFPASIRLLQMRPEAVSVARISMMMVREHEQKFAQPVVDVTDVENTKRLRAILRQLRDGDLTEDDVRVGVAKMAMQATALKDRFGYETLIRVVAAAATRQLSKSRRKLLRSAFHAEDYAALSQDLVPDLTEEGLLDSLVAVAKIPRAKARKLVRFPSFAVLVVLAPLTLSLRWATLGGFQNTRELENDGIDMENAMIALYGRDFISKDRRARAQYETLRTIVRARWP